MSHLEQKNKSTLVVFHQSEVSTFLDRFCSSHRFLFAHETFIGLITKRQPIDKQKKNSLCRISDNGQQEKRSG